MRPSRENMPKHIVLIGSMFVVFAVTAITVLWLLDLITVQALRTTVGRTVSVIGMLTAATFLVALIVRFGRNA